MRIHVIIVVLLIAAAVSSKKKKKKKKMKSGRAKYFEKTGMKKIRSNGKRYSDDHLDSPQYSHDEIHLITCTTCHCLIRKIVRLKKVKPEGSPYRSQTCNYVHGPDKYKQLCGIFLEEYGDWLIDKIDRGTTAYTICEELGACTDEILNVKVSGGRADMIFGSNVDKIFGLQCRVDNQLMLDYYSFFHSKCDSNPRASKCHVGGYRYETNQELINKLRQEEMEKLEKMMDAEEDLQKKMSPEEIMEKLEKDLEKSVIGETLEDVKEEDLIDDIGSEEL